MQGQLSSRQGKILAVFRDVATIGRSFDCTVRLEDKASSRIHAMIRRERDHYFALDVGSVNGTYINNARLVGRCALRSGDVIRIGETTLAFQLAQSPEVLAKTPFLAKTERLPQALGPTDEEQFYVFMVADLKGFTRLSELIGPRQIARLMHDWYESCSYLISGVEGNIEKFIGDAMFAYWPDPRGTAVEQAVCAADRFREACDELTRWHTELLAENQIELSAGIGIHRGLASISESIQGHPTILGDAVNITFRVEALTRSLHRDVLITQNAAEHLAASRPRLADMGDHPIRGGKRQVRLHALGTSDFQRHFAASVVLQRPAAAPTPVPAPGPLTFPATFLVVRLVFSNVTEYEIRALDGRKVARVQEQALELGSTFRLFSMTGALNATGRRRPFSWGAEFALKNHDSAPLGTIREEISGNYTLFNSSYSIFNPANELLGTSYKIDLYQPSFRISHDGHVLCQMLCKDMNVVGEYWEISLQNGKLDPRFALFIAVFKTQIDQANKAEFHSV